jgi:hypothetical protein
VDGILRLQEGVEGKVVGLEVQPDCLKVSHVLRDHTNSVSGVVELEGLLGHTFQLFLQLDEICCRS